MAKTRVYSISLGCPKNRVDAEVMLGSIPGGIALADAPEAADLVLVNTCSFIRPAVEESVETILELAEALRDLKPKPLLAVAGCLPVRYGEELRKEMPEVDFWGEPSELALWSERIGRALGLSAGDPEQARRLLSTPPGYAYLKISEGCNHACNYCTIPSIRGRLQSRPMGALADEAADILESGVSELVLVAQDLCAYGRDLDGDVNLLALLEKLSPLPGLSWLRLMYLYPSGMTKTFLRGLQSLGPKLLPYFDIPFQHVHPEVLRAMGRPKSAGAQTVVDRVRQAFPEAAIRTAFIVGHPGETPARFQALLDFVEKNRLTHVGVFPFHPEEGTPSAALPRRISGKEKLRRRDCVMTLQREISAKILSEYVGRTMPVMVDAPHPEWPGLFVGRTWFQAPEVDGVTYVSGPGVAAGKLVMAEIVEAKDYDLTALA
jgi:ribosomal protein S12 methylthiotransferase